MKLAMLLLAAGRGTRFGGAVPKVYLPLCGKAVLLHAAERLCQLAERLGRTTTLVVVVSPADRAPHLRPLLPALESLGARVVDGGESRQQSMQLGLDAAPADCELVVVHDAARPLFPVDAAARCVERAREVGAALLAVPATDTLKRVDAGGRVRQTVDRSDIWYAQTPQAVRRELLVAALEHADAARLRCTDDVALVEALGAEVAAVTGSPLNLKITRAEDLTFAEALLTATQGTDAPP